MLNTVKSKLALSIAAVLLLAIGFIAGQRVNRYVIVNSRIPLRLDRVTGNSWFFDGENWNPARVMPDASNTASVK